jgi:hypothetical protein
MLTLYISHSRFAIAEEALDCMRRGQTAGGEVGGTADQTIVVSGERYVVALAQLILLLTTS